MLCSRSSNVFLATWYSVTGHAPVPRPDMKAYDITNIGVILVFLVPLTVFFFARSRAQRFLSLAASSVLLVIIYQFIGVAKSYYINGRFGGYSSRYFLCAISFFALAIIWMIVRYFVTPKTIIGTDAESSKKSCAVLEYHQTQSGQLTRLGTSIVLGLVLLLFMDGFIYSFLYQADQISAFQL